MVLKKKAANFLDFSYCQQISCAEPNQQLTDLLTSIVCLSKAWYIVFLCEKNTAELGDMFLYPEEYGDGSLFWNGSRE